MHTEWSLEPDYIQRQPIRLDIPSPRRWIIPGPGSLCKVALGSPCLRSNVAVLTRFYIYDWGHYHQFYVRLTQTISELQTGMQEIIQPFLEAYI